MDLDPWVSMTSSGVMALIWVLYLQLFWREQRRRHRPFLLIHHATSQSPRAPCIFVNMSQEPVHVQCVIARVQRGDESRTIHLTEYSRYSRGDRRAEEAVREGPIQSGGYIVLGTFGDILLGRDAGIGDLDADRDDDSLERYHQRLQAIDSLEICVAVIHGQSDHPVGARRAFFIERRDGSVGIRAYNIHTEQLVTRGKRKTVRHWLEERLEPRLQGGGQTDQTEQEQAEEESSG